jgi:hypothetical protein
VDWLNLVRVVLGLCEYMHTLMMLLVGWVVVDDSYWWMVVVRGG